MSVMVHTVEPSEQVQHTEAIPIAEEMLPEILPVPEPLTTAPPLPEELPEPLPITVMVPEVFPVAEPLVVELPLTEPPVEETTAAESTVAETLAGGMQTGFTTKRMAGLNSYAPEAVAITDWAASKSMVHS